MVSPPVRSKFKLTNPLGATTYALEVTFNERTSAA